MVVREICVVHDGSADYEFSAIVGVYGSINRAEEMCGVSAQALRDAGADEGDYRFTVKASAYYDE